MADNLQEQFENFRRQQQQQEDVDFLPSVEEMEEMDLLDRLRRLPTAARRRTLGAFYSEYVPDVPNTSMLQESSHRTTQGYQPEVPKDKEKTIYVNTQGRKLKVFSGEKKPRSGEQDYRQWRRSAVRILEDEELSDSRKKKIILDSLQGKADDIVDFHRDENVSQILKILDANYKNLVDGDDLLADFYQMFQEESQNASDFLSDLYVELVEVVKEGGTSLLQSEKLLMKQFVRGCRDDSLVTKLELEKRFNNPIQFPELMSMVRREEARRTERKLRLKKSAQSRAATAENVEFLQLQGKVLELESKCQSMQLNVAADSETVQLQQRISKLEEELEKVRKHSFFCYKCGIDNHIASECKNAPNKPLVRLKLEQRQAGKGSEN